MAGVLSRSCDARADMIHHAPGPPWRIAVLQPSVSLLLDRLDCLDSIAACTRYCLEAVPALKSRDVKVIADSWSSTTEEILSVSPNLVLASVPYRLESLAAILKSGCPVVTLAPHVLADIYQDMRLLGSILHANDRAERMVAEMQSGIDAIRAQLALAAERSPACPLVYCEEWGKPLIHSQAWVAELVSAAGGSFLDARLGYSGGSRRRGRSGYSVLRLVRRWGPRPLGARRRDEALAGLTRCPCRPDVLHS